MGNSMKTIPVSVKKLPSGAELPLPKYETVESAGMDLAAAIEENVVLNPGERTLIPTGIAIGLEPGFEAQLRPRSGLALKHGITVLNTPGTIDADYRGEIKVILINHGDTPFTIEPGMRIAQMVIAPVNQAMWIEVDSFQEHQTTRSAGGFGSTGLYVAKK